MKKTFSFLIIIISLIFVFTAFNSVMAQDKENQAGAETTDESVKLDNPLAGADGEEGVTEPQVIVGRIIDIILGMVGSLALLMFVYGGIVWMTSSGSPEKVKKGKNILVWSILGLAIIFFSYAMVKFVIVGITGV
jgi:Zn-dependent protease with chaperone function